MQNHTMSQEVYTASASRIAVPPIPIDAKHAYPKEKSVYSSVRATSSASPRTASESAKDARSNDRVLCMCMQIEFVCFFSWKKRSAVAWLEPLYGAERLKNPTRRVARCKRTEQNKVELNRTEQYI